jgi:putative hydrolase of HD superfamily
MQQIVDFILELDRLKGVTRKTRPLGLDRYENSAEHSWQIALLAASLESYAQAPVDIDRVIAMLLVHDIGEIDTGDTIVFAVGGWDERKQAELAAVTRIFGMLPEPKRSHFLELWTEFERGETAESLFANAADRAMPVLLNLANRGQSWRENGITHDRVVARVAPQIRAGCPALWDYLEARLEEARRSGWFGAGEAPAVIDKVAWIHIRDGRLLCVRSHGKDSFYMPGGKREPGESDEACVEREVNEELGVTLRPATLRAVGVFEAQADGKPEGTLVRIACWSGEFDGRLEARAEIAELAWLSHADRDRCSPAAQLILDELHRRGEVA